MPQQEHSRRFRNRPMTMQIRYHLQRNGACAHTKHMPSSSNFSSHKMSSGCVYCNMTSWQRHLQSFALISTQFWEEVNSWSSMAKIFQVQDKLWTAVRKSRGSHSEDLVRAIARACLSVPGFQACATGYLMLPASFSRIAWYIRNDCPDYSFIDDFDNTLADSSDRQGNEYDYSDQNHHMHDTAADEWTLTNLLELKQCQRYFTILHRSDSSQPYVAANLQALIAKPQLPKVQDLLPIVHTVTVHPDNPAFPEECARLQTVQPSAPVPSQVCLSVMTCYSMLTFSNVSSLHARKLTSPRPCLRIVDARARQKACAVNLSERAECLCRQTLSW